MSYVSPPLTGVARSGSPVEDRPPPTFAKRGKQDKIARRLPRDARLELEGGSNFTCMPLEKKPGGRYSFYRGSHHMTPAADDSGRRFGMTSVINDHRQDLPGDLTDLMNSILFQQTIPRHLVHRAAVSEVFLTNLAANRADAFQ